VYYICVKAYTALSVSLKVEEGAWNRKLAGEFDLLYNFFLHTEKAQQFTFSKGELADDRAVIQVDAAVYTTGNGDQTDILIFYKLCTSGDCFLDAEEASGNGDVEMLPVERVVTKSGDFTQVAVETSFNYEG